MARSDEKNQMNKLPPVTLALVVIAFVVICAGIIGLLFPEYKGIAAAEKTRTEKMLHLEEQKKIFPLFARAKAMERIPFDPALPLVERTPLARDQIASLSNTFSDIAGSHSMILTGNSLDINSLQSQSGTVSMTIELTGDLFDFRDCLVSLAKLPCFKAIEAVNIETDNTNIKTFTTKILMAITKK